MRVADATADWCKSGNRQARWRWLIRATNSKPARSMETIHKGLKRFRSLRGVEFRREIRDRTRRLRGRLLRRQHLTHRPKRASHRHFPACNRKAWRGWESLAFRGSSRLRNGPHLQRYREFSPRDSGDEF